jgi:hypothetical protein
VNHQLLLVAPGNYAWPFLLQKTKTGEDAYRVLIA